MDSNIAPTLPSVVILSTSILDGIDLAQGFFKKSLGEKNFEMRPEFENRIKDLPKDSKTFQTLYTLDTKYYTADIRLVCVTYEHIHSKINFDESSVDLSDLGVASTDALIFVSNLKSSSSTYKEGVNEYKKLHKEYMEIFGSESVVCFANIEENSNMDLYALFEYGEDEFMIEVISDDIEKLTEIDPDAKPNLEKDGVERMIESLECIMWPNMNKKAKPQAPKRPASKKQEEEKPKEEQTNNTQSKSTEDQKNETDGTKKLDKPLSEQGKPLEDKPVTSQDKVNEIFKDMLGDEENEMEDFTAIIHQMTQLRMNSQNLSDKDRREQAANLIMKLMNNCKELDGDEFNDAEDEDEDLADMKKLDELEKAKEKKEETAVDDGKN